MKQDFETVIRENTAWLSAYVRRKMNGGSSWEDMVQEIFVKAFRAYDNYEEDGRLRGWLARIAENTMKNYFVRSVPMPMLYLRRISAVYRKNCLILQKICGYTKHFI